MAKDNWDELNDGKHNRFNRKSRKKKHRQSSTSRDLDEAYASSEEDKFLSTLASKQSTYGWMKEDRYKRMFRDIENKIQGALGTGTFDWVDRRVFDQVFDRLTLMSLYKLMKTGVQNEVQTGTWNHQVHEKVKKMKYNENTFIYNTFDRLGHHKSADVPFKNR